MPVVEHQFLHYRNLLSYTTRIEDSRISAFVVGVEKNIHVLDLELKGDVIVTKSEAGTEFIIPIDKSFSSNKHFKFKPEFKLVNALRIRHYGSFSTISERVEELRDYMTRNSLTAVTPPYFIVKNCRYDIYDVLIGISENVL